jgi:hypothetical protein
VEFGIGYFQEGFANLFDEHKVVNTRYRRKFKVYKEIFLDFVYESPPMTNKTILQS